MSALQHCGGKLKLQCRALRFWACLVRMDKKIAAAIFLFVRIAAPAAIAPSA
jgi:hypothetical protein